MESAKRGKASLYCLCSYFCSLVSAGWLADRPSARVALIGSIFHSDKTILFERDKARISRLDGRLEVELLSLSLFLYIALQLVRVCVNLI